MNWTHKPLELSELAGAPQLYVYMVGIAFAAIIFVFLVVQTIRHGFAFRPALPSVGRLTLFLIVLLAVSAVAQMIWSSFVWGRLYHTPDYVFGYLPFVPITQHELDTKFAGQAGSLNGVTLMHVNLIWSLLTLGVWALSYWIYRRLRPRFSHQQRLPHSRLTA